MPYTKNADLPTSIRNTLPDAAQTIYREAHNAAEIKYAIGTKGIIVWVAWMEVKKKYERTNGKWIKIEGVG